jgi:hypothetical protein
VKAAVTIMKEMREVRKARYRLDTFADAVKVRRTCFSILHLLTGRRRTLV